MYVKTLLNSKSEYNRCAILRLATKKWEKDEEEDRKRSLNRKKDYQEREKQRQKKKKAEIKPTSKKKKDPSGWCGYKRRSSENSENPNSEVPKIKKFRKRKLPSNKI